MVGEDETRLSRAVWRAQEQAKRIPLWASALLGALSFGGWLGALALDAKVFSHNALGSFLVHIPLMLLPAALVLARGLPRLPEAERTTWRVVSACALVVVLSVPALVPNLNQQPIILPLCLPVYGLALAMALVDPGLRVGLDHQGPRRLSPGTMAGIAFGVCAVATVIIMLWRPQPPTTCRELSCGVLVGLVDMMLCGGSLCTALIAVIGAALGYKLGKAVRI